MTRISKSPLKHKQGNYKAHRGSDGILYGERLYHEKFGGNIEDDPIVTKEKPVVKKKPTVEPKTETEPKAQPTSIYTEGNNLEVYRKFGPKDETIILKEGEILGDFDSADEVYNPEKEVIAPEVKKQMKLNSKVTKSFDESGVGTIEVPLLVNMRSAKKDADPLKPSGGFYKSNDNWYDSLDLNQQWAITNPSHISFLEEQLSLTNKLEWEELPSEYFTSLGIDEPGRTEQYKADEYVANLSDYDKMIIADKKRLEAAGKEVQKSVAQVTKAADIRNAKGGYLTVNEFSDAIAIDGNIEDKTALNLNRNHQGKLYEDGYVSFTSAVAGDDVLVMRRVERADILAFIDRASNLEPTEELILKIAKNPGKYLHPDKITEEKVWLPSDWNDSGDQIGINTIHTKYRKLIQPSATDEQIKKDAVKGTLEFQDENWLNFYNPDNQFKIKDGKIVGYHKDQKEVLYSEFLQSIKKKTKEKGGRFINKGSKYKYETRGTVTRVTTEHIRQGTSVYNLPITTYSGPQGWTQDQMKKYYAKLKLMDESSEIAEQVFSTNLLKSEQALKIAASDDYVDVSEQAAEMTTEVKEALTTEDVQKITSELEGESLSQAVLEDLVEYENNENKEQADILEKKFVDHSEETRLKFELDFQEGASKILTDNPEYLDVLDEEFKGKKEEVLSKFDEIDAKYQNLAQAQYDLIYQKRLKELQDEVRNGQHTGLDENELSKELNKRISAEHEGVIMDLNKRLMAEKITISEPLDKEITERHQELVDELLAPYEEEASARYSVVMEKMAKDFYEKSMANGNIGNYEIDDGVFESLMSDVSEGGYSRRGMTHEGRNKILGHHWHLYEKTLIEQGKTKGQIQDIKKEFVHRVALQTTFGQSGLTETAIRTMADDAIKELSGKKNLSDGQEKMLEEALKIKNAPQNMSKWGVTNFVNGFGHAAQKAKGWNWVPIASDVINWHEQKEVRRLAEIPEKDRTADENRALMLYHHRGIIEGKVNEMSTAFNVGEGSLETVKFMIELVATRGLSNALSKSVRLGLSSKLALANTRTLARYRRAKGISKSAIKSKIVMNQAAAKTFAFLSHAVVPTFTTGLGKIAVQYEMQQTPEMAFAMSTDGDDIIAKLDVYNEQWLEDNAPDKEYITVDGKQTKNPNYNPDFDMDAAERGDPFIELMRASGHVYTDYMTERLGMLLPHAGKYLKTDIMKNPDWLKRVFLGRLMKKLNIPPGSENALQKLMQAGGYNGMAGEIFEEIAALPLHNLLDGNDLGQGLDAKFFKEVGLQTAIFQGVFSVGGKMYTVATGQKDPSYIVGKDHWRSPEDVIEAAKVAKRDQVDKEFIEVDGKQVENPNYDPSFKFQIDNDISTLLKVEEILEGTTIEAESSNFDIEVNDLKTATEIEGEQTMNEEDVKEVEETTTKIQEQEKKEQDLLKQAENEKDKEKKNKLFEEAKKIRDEIKNLKQFRSDIVTPTIELINNHRSKPLYEKILKNVVNIAAMIDPNLQVIEVGSTEEMRALAMDEKREEILGGYGINSVLDAETGKRIYFSSKNNLQLSASDVSQIVQPGGVDNKKIFEQLEKDIESQTDDFKSTHGFTDDKNNTLFINKEASLNLGASNVAAHEFLHRFLNKTFGQNPHTKLAIGRALENELMQMNVNGIKNSDFKRRIATYQNEQGQVISAEETLNLFSDALMSGEMVFNETRMTKIGDMFRRTFSSMGMRVEFATGRDVFNFIRDYNKAITSPKGLSKGMVKTMKKGVKLKGEIKWGSDAYAKLIGKMKKDNKGQMPLFSKEASDNVQRIYKEKGKAGAFEIAQEYRGMAEKVYNSYTKGLPQDLQDWISSQPMGLDLDGNRINSVKNDVITGSLFMSTKLAQWDGKGKRPANRSVVGMVENEFDIKKQAYGNIAAYINQFFGVRMIEEFKDILPQEYHQNLPGEDTSTKPKPKTPQRKARDLTSLANLYLISTPIMVRNKIQILINQNPKDLEQQITKLIEGEVTKYIKSEMGKISNIKGEVVISPEYKAFMALNYTGIVQGFDITTIKNNYNQLFELKKIGTESKITRKADKPGLKKDSYYEKGIFEIVTNKAKFTKYFIEGGYTTLLARQKALAGHIAEAITGKIVNDQIINLSENNDAIVKAELKKLSETLNRQKVEIQGNYDDILRYSKEGWDQASELHTRTKQAEFVDQVWNIDKSSKFYGTPLDPMIGVNGRVVPWIPEYVKKMFDLVEAEKIMPERIKDKLWERLIRNEQTVEDNNAGDALERIQWTRLKDGGLIAIDPQTGTEYTLGEENIIALPLHTFEGGIVQKSDLYLKSPLGPVGMELKMPNAKMGHNSGTKWDISTGTYILSNNPQWYNDKLDEVFGKIMPGMAKLSRYLKKEYDVNWTKREHYIPFEKDGQQVYNNETVVELRKKTNNNEVRVDGDFVAHHYNSKGVFYIHITGLGTFYLGSDPLGFAESLGMTKFEGSFNLQGRLLASRKTDGGKVIGRYMGMDAEAVLDSRRVTSDVGFNMDDPGGLDLLKNAANNIEILYSKEAGDGNSKIVGKAIEVSRTVNPAKGMSAWDLDDTLARTKSGVRYTIPNPSMTPQPSRKVIFLAGGPGSGKSSIINSLGLKKQGFKVVNQDISLEWLMKNHGLPSDMKDFTPEQASKFGSLSWDARMIAKRKQAKFQGKGDGIIVDGTGNSLQVMKDQVQQFKNKGYDVQMIFVETSLETALERNSVRKERSLKNSIVERTHKSVQNNKRAFKELFGGNFVEVKTDNLKQGDPTPSKVVNKMDVFTKGYIKGRLSAEEFANEGENILEQDGEFDFSEFDIIKEGEQGPLFNKAMESAKKFGLKDQFILTARPHAAKVAIYRFLDAQGLNIPFDNIITLEDSSPEAKALWIAEKVGEGYNDIYFADDALQNVQAVDNMLEQFDVKRKVQQAKRQDLYGNVKTKSKKDAIKFKLGDIDNLDSPNNYNNIKFSKSHRNEYEKTITKHRPDLVEAGLVSKTVDNMFVFIDNLNIPDDKRRKYEKITTKWLATSNVKLIEDRYKITDAINLAERFKLDLFSYNNPNEIIEAYAGKVKGKPINPNKVKEFRSSGDYPKRGLTTYDVENTKEGQQAVRDVIDSHWGENSNPWCLTQAKNGKLTDDAWQNWTVYDKGPKRIVFQDGKLSSFFANGQFWDRMDNATDGPAIILKEGRVTKKVELVEVGDGKFEEFVMETKTVSEDGNTITTEFNTDREYDQGLFVDEAGTKIVENRVNGVTVKETKYRPNGDVRKITEFKDGKPISTRVLAKGRTTGINVHNEHSIENGDFLQQEVAEGKTEFWYGWVSLEAQGIKSEKWGFKAFTPATIKLTEIGFQAPVGLDLMNIVKTVDGKMRVDFPKLLKIDPNVKGLPATGILFSKSANDQFNDILESTTGIGSQKIFSDTQAKIKGAKGKYKGIIPASAQDFTGLLYNFLGKGKKGEQDMAFFKKVLIDPFARGVNEMNSAKQSSANDYKNLLKKFPEVRKKLNKKIKGSDFTVDQAIRVYLWNKAGFEVPGLSKRDLKTLVDVIVNDSQMQVFAEALGSMSKKEAGYSKPSEYWLVENIGSDLLSDGAIGDARSTFLAEWQQNIGEVFSKTNLNKIEAIYGSRFREALEDVLYRMKTGRNRPTGSSRLMNTYMNWVNNSVGAIMFFNMRSAVLQTISLTNYLNWSDNNPAKAALAFANQKQFWSDFVMIFNSDYLKQRRSGNQRSVNESELSAAVMGSDNKVKAALAWLLKKGFLPTQIADSFAIASGGASFFRNRVKTYVKQGMSQTEAEAKAWIDFQETTEVSQQSARPDMISQQQASPLGRLILAFQNTPMQYARIMNKAARDLVNGRGDSKTHISKIAYYGVVQSIIFGALQSALFSAIGDDDEDEFDKKKERIINQMMDSWLSGIGVGGKAIGTVKNTIMEYLEQKDKGYQSDHAYTLLALLGFSPPIGSKVRKIYSAIQTDKFNEDVYKKRGWSLDNPIWNAIGNVIEGVTNIPLGRLSNKMLNLDNAMDSSNEWWQRVALTLGWNTWDLGIRDKDVEAVKTEIKEEKKIETKKKQVVKKKEREKEKEEEELDLVKENIEKQEQEKKDGKKDIKCAAISKSGNRCKTNIEPGQSYCTIHEKVEQNKSGKEVQCKKMKQISKKKTKRCGMMTNSKSGYCYYHD